MAVMRAFQTAETEKEEAASIFTKREIEAAWDDLRGP